MASSSPPYRSLLSSTPPELESIDEAWGEERPTEPGDPSDRVTQIPSMPSELLAQRLMREAAMARPDGEDAEGRDVSPRPLQAPPPDLGRSSEALTYRPPIASALTPGSPFFGSAPEPKIFESDSLELAPDVFGDGHDPFSAHEAPTKSAPKPPDPLELDLELEGGASAALQRAEHAAMHPPTSGLELARRLSSLPAAPPNPLQDMKDRYAMGDFSGALDVAEKILAGEPDQEEAYRCAQSCRDVLTDMYTSRLGGTQQRVVVTMSPDQIRWLSLDHRAGFLLSMVDGVSTVDELLDICGMPRIEALRILCVLLDQHAVVLQT